MPKDLKHWERLDNLKTLHSPQQRNVVLHPEFIHGKYAFYTRPMDDFIDTGSGGGIGFGLCDMNPSAVCLDRNSTRTILCLSDCVILEAAAESDLVFAI